MVHKDQRFHWVTGECLNGMHFYDTSVYLHINVLFSGKQTHLTEQKNIVPIRFTVMGGEQSTMYFFYFFFIKYGQIYLQPNVCENDFFFK